MDTNQNSTQAVSPKAIAAAFEALSRSMSSPLDLHAADGLTMAAGYDWAAGIAVRDALNAGADPWLVLQMLSDIVRARAEAEDTIAGVATAFAMLDKAELIRRGRLDPSPDAVRWRLMGMIADSEGSAHVTEASRLLDAAMWLVLNADANDDSVAHGLLEKTARGLVRDVFIMTSLRTGEHRTPGPKKQALAEAESLLERLHHGLAAAMVANENGTACVG